MRMVSLASPMTRSRVTWLRKFMPVTRFYAVIFKVYVTNNLSVCIIYCILHYLVSFGINMRINGIRSCPSRPWFFLFRKNVMSV